MAFFDCSGIRLMLTMPEERSGDIHTSILYYKVDDIQDAYRILKDRDVRFNGRRTRIADLEDHELWMAFFRGQRDEPFGAHGRDPLAAIG